MADAATDALRAADRDTLSKSSKSGELNTTKNMTVDKTVKTEQPAPGGSTSTPSTKQLGGQQTSTATAAPRGSPPTQMKAAPGNVTTASPRKQDSRGGSPQSKSSSAADSPNASKSSLQPTQQQQQPHACTKSSPKKNPWNRNPSTNPPPTGGEGKKSQAEGPVGSKSTMGRTASEGSSPFQKDPSASGSIKIPRNEVPAVILLHLMPNCAPHSVCTNCQLH